LGNRWCLELYPGGKDDNTPEGMVTLDLCHISSEEGVIFDYSFSIIDGNCKQVAYGDDDDIDHWGFDVKRSKLMRSLVDGALVIEIRMRLANPTDSVPPPFIPKNPSACKIIRDCS
jgi:hypothetical protein